MPRPTPADSVMPMDWSTRPSSSMATHERGEVAVVAHAAELLGHDEAEQAQVAHLRHQVAREVVVLVPLGDVRLDLGLGELPDDLAEVLVLLAQLEHRFSFVVRARVVAPGHAAYRGRGVCLTLT